ncbi:MAG: STAS domain-containing protein [Candidatus Omnitrophica bacterium]|nr:STAS domain-containing protein [Candidatus Omnitrophota bacterium]
MEIKSRIQDNVTIIQVIGSLDSNVAQQAEEEINKHVRSNCSLVLDMAECNYISSSGLRVLLAVGKQLQSNSGNWAFAALSDEIMDVMNMTGFGGFFKICPDVEEAIKSIKP